MSNKDIKQNQTSKQPLNRFEKTILLNHQISPEFIVNLRASHDMPHNTDPDIQSIWDEYQVTGAPASFTGVVQCLAVSKSGVIWLFVMVEDTYEKYRFSTLSNLKSMFNLRKAKINQFFDIVTKETTNRHVLVDATPTDLTKRMT